MQSVVILGGGFSGTLAAVHLLRAGLERVTLMESRQEVAAGVAYSTREPWHLLNVRANNMSALADEPAHFAGWLERHGGGTPGDFAERRRFREYLQELLAQSRDERLEIIRSQAVALDREGEQLTVRIAGGRTISASAAILAGGNLPPRRPPLLSQAREAGMRYVVDPWGPDGPAALAEIAREKDDVLILGTGLTMVDVCLTLDGHGFRGRIVASSRRGLVPHAHEHFSPAPLDKPETRLGPLLRQTRRRAEEHGWRAAVDALRPHSISLWQGFTGAEKRSFITHLRPHWDVRRHRIAPEVAAPLERLRDEGRLEVVAGRVGNISQDEVSIGRRGGGDFRGRFGAIVNCTGPGRDIGDAADPLVQHLLASGTGRPDPLGLGFDVDDSSRLVGADGIIHPDIFVLGPLSRGRFWEIVAVPDIRGQAASVAKELLRVV